MNPDEPKPALEAPAPQLETKPAPGIAPKPEPKPKAAAELKPADHATPPTATARSQPAKTGLGNKIIFTLAILGIMAGLVAAYFFGLERKAQPPVFNPVSNPYESAIFANGMIESDQPSGENINIFPEVSGPVTSVLVHEGQKVSAGATLFTIDDSVQRATTEQLKLQSEAALALWNELKAQPRPETLAIAAAQVGLAESSLKLARGQYDKDRAAYDIDPQSITKIVLDTAEDTVSQAGAALDVARKQYALVKAGAWSYDIDNQEKQSQALAQAYKAASALLVKFSFRAPVDGVALAVNAALGGYVSSQGVYDTYTGLFAPLVIMGGPQEFLQVRCYVDEILVSRLPPGRHIQAQMQIIGTDLKIPLEFVRIQPFVSPKIELSNQKQEQVDLRVLPVIFRFEKEDAPVYPGLMVNVFIGKK